MDKKELKVYKLGDVKENLEVISEPFKKYTANGKYRTVVNCRCVCGNEIDLEQSDLREEKRKSCGCFVNKIKEQSSYKTGYTKDNLTIIREPFKKEIETGKYRTFITCRCICGEEIDITIDKLKAIKSCGCKLIKYKLKIGDTHEKLTVISEPFKKIKEKDKEVIVVTCKCECGNKIDLEPSKFVRQKSCGCLVSNYTDFSEYKIGNKFGSLTCISEPFKKHNDDGTFRTVIKCKCSCEEEIELQPSELKTRKSCGCKQFEEAWNTRRMLDIDRDYNKIILPIGSVHGYWEVISDVIRKRTKDDIIKLYKCRCICGNVRNVEQYTLKSQKRISCGCIGNAIKTDNFTKQLRIGNTIRGLTVVSEPYQIVTNIGKAVNIYKCRCICNNVTDFTHEQLVHEKNS